MVIPGREFMCFGLPPNQGDVIQADVWLHDPAFQQDRILEKCEFKHLNL